MNWTKVLIAAVVAGVVIWLVMFLLHGVVMGNTYTTYDTVFSQEQASPFWFLAVSIVGAIAAAVLFAKSRACWGAGLGGGIQFGVLVGLVVGFVNFYHPLTIADFPYYLAWCWLGIDVISYGILGGVFALIYKAET